MVEFVAVALVVWIFIRLLAIVGVESFFNFFLISLVTGVLC